MIGVVFIIIILYFSIKILIKEKWKLNIKEPSEVKSKKILFKLTEELFNDFSDFCETHDTTKSEVIRKLITNYLNEKEIWSKWKQT